MRLRRKIEGAVFVGLMRLSLGLSAAVLLSILVLVLLRGFSALSWEMLTQPPRGGFFLGGGGGILNAIAGSFYLATGATLLALLFAVPLVLYLQITRGRLRDVVRLALDVLWGLPSILYGAFGFALMIWLGLRASLLAGIITLAFVIFPILARTLDEVMQLITTELREATLSLGTTRTELAVVLLRQAAGGLATATVLAFGRAIGDAASVLFTAGYTDRLPRSLFDPVASLPLAVFFQLGTPFPSVQARAYAAALVLTVIVLVCGVVSELVLARVGRHSIR